MINFHASRKATFLTGETPNTFDFNVIEITDRANRDIKPGCPASANKPGSGRQHERGDRLTLLLLQLHDLLLQEVYLILKVDDLLLHRLGRRNPSGGRLSWRNLSWCRLSRSRLLFPATATGEEQRAAYR